MVVEIFSLVFLTFLLGVAVGIYLEQKNPKGNRYCELEQATTDLYLHAWWTPDRGEHNSKYLWRVLRDALRLPPGTATQKLGADRSSLTYDDPSMDSPVSVWFKLSYAQFLTIPRIFLCHMPYMWQKVMVELLEELDRTFKWLPQGGSRYWVSLRDSSGRYQKLDSNVCDYRHGSVERHQKKVLWGEVATPRGKLIAEEPHQGTRSW